MRGYTVSARCNLCHAWFYYVRTNPHGRKRSTCDRCKVDHKRKQGKDRQARLRQRRREAKDHPSKRSGGNRPRPAPVGSREGTKRATPKRKAKGLYSELPEPGRTTRRKAVGLP